MTVSAITAADEAFTVLAARPAPLAFDARGIPALPQRHLDLLELRGLLTTAHLPAATTDLVWRRLAAQARDWGPAWVVAAVGMAVPGLGRVATRLTGGFTHLAQDIDSEVVAGFLTELRTTDLQAPRVWLRLLWAAWRSGQRLHRTREMVQLPEDLPAGASTPRVPYGHPDLLLGRAAAAGIITADEAALIGDTRLGEVLVEELAARHGVTAPVLRMRRHRAEHRLLTALSRGRVSDIRLAVPATRDPAARARRDGLPAPTRTAPGPLHGSAVRDQHHRQRRPDLGQMARAVQALRDGPGLFLLRGLPIADIDESALVVVLRGLGGLFGTLMPQTRAGELVRAVSSKGSDYSSPTVRGHDTNAALPYHCDRADLIGLLCVRPAASGGRSLIASAAAAHEVLRKREPDLLQTLYEPFPHDLRGEHGLQPWVELPVFATCGGHFVCRYIRRFVEDAVRYPGAPALQERQRAALDALDAVLTESGVPLEMDLAEGDLQLLNNLVLVHSRTAFQDDGPQGRLLLRIWVAPPWSAPLPPAFEPLYGCVEAGAARGGVQPHLLSAT